MAPRIPVADKSVLSLAVSLREAELIDTAKRLARAYDREARIVSRDITDREAIRWYPVSGVPRVRQGGRVEQTRR